LQQAGRTGRGNERLDKPSLAIVVCFNSPAEQHMWRKPQTLLAIEITSPHSVPSLGTVLQGHLLCAGEECPLIANRPAALTMGSVNESAKIMPTDQELFGGTFFEEALNELKSSNSLIAEKFADPMTTDSFVMAYRPRPSFRKAWSRVSIRSIEPINYSIVDISHPQQGGRMDSIHSNEAVLDTLPYSRGMLCSAFDGQHKLTASLPVLRSLLPRSPRVRSSNKHSR
jgi:DEAD/DEAH box helicase domain-containing protein